MAIKKHQLLIVVIVLLCAVGVTIALRFDMIARSLVDRAFYNAVASFSPGAYDLNRVEHWLRVVQLLADEYPGLQYQRARLHFVRGDLDRALEDINAEIALRPDYARAFYLKGLIETYRNDFAGAVLSFASFNASRPDNWAGFNDLAYAYLQMGNYADAEQATTRGLANDSSNIWLRMNRGVALLNLDQAQEAREIFEGVIRDANSLHDSNIIAAYPGNDPKLAPRAIIEIREAARLNQILSEGGEAPRSAGYLFIAAVQNGKGFAIAACDESAGIDVAPPLIIRGQSSSLSWLLSNVENCSIDNGVGSVGYSPSSRSVSPLNSTLYTLTCNSISADHLHDMSFIETAQLRVRWADITASGNSGPFSDGPLTLYMPNTATRVSWQSEEASSCSATGDLSGPITVDGSRDLGHLTRGSGTPGLGRLYRFGVNCEGASDSVDVRVMQLPTCTISPNKTTVTPPETVGLNWSCRYADSGTIADNHGGTPVALSINNNADYQSSGIVQVRISDNQAYIYTLRAIGIDGTTSVASVVINGPSDGVRIREDLP